MSRLRYNPQKFRYEGRTRAGLPFAVDERWMQQCQLYDLKDGGTGDLTPLLEASRWEAQIGKNPRVYYFDPLLEQYEEEQAARRRAELKRKRTEARKATRAQIRSYLQKHPDQQDDRRVASLLGTTRFQVRRVRQEMRNEAR